MLINELIGRAITDVYVISWIKDGWLGCAECFIELDNEMIIDIPYGHSNEVWIKPLNDKAISIFKESRIFREFHEYKLKYIQNKKIKDFLSYEDESEKGFLELESGVIITETTMSPSGTGQSGLNYFESLDTMVFSHGADYKRLTAGK